MKKPELILFDYGQTLVNEERYNVYRGNAALLKKCRSVPEHVTAEYLTEKDDRLNFELGRYVIPDPREYKLELRQSEVYRYLLESEGVESGLTPLELERTVWDNAAPGTATEGIAQLLDFLHESGIRTGVISNISFSGQALAERINRLIPTSRFEFIIASSDYVFRKPNSRIFTLALKKAGVRAENAWYCGDHAYFDIGGASGAGIMPVWYRGAQTYSDEPEVEEYLEVMSWQEFRDIIEKCE